MRGPEEGKQVPLQRDPHGADRDAHGERADDEEPPQHEPGTADTSEGGECREQGQARMDFRLPI